jgi:hypothetical protein
LEWLLGDTVLSEESNGILEVKSNNWEFALEWLKVILVSNSL